MFPTPLQHPGYKDATRHPNGILDFAGYWVKVRLFSSVVLFNRGADVIEETDYLILGFGFLEPENSWLPPPAEKHPEELTAVVPRQFLDCQEQSLKGADAPDPDEPVEEPVMIRQPKEILRASQS
ncbi:hypothetical protein MKZ38_003987 [Zalerion maritima]|uniref:Uncharacterized protein n=1 Tax=Zalerion maritima TaxID=339359 RepID=A0AAD5RTF2_9PEZI|nr:hypothetical protein MKZ38_003987 [Zalerion maritima]